jgi:membrane protease YdiL (CAAX protease family)
MVTMAWLGGWFGVLTVVYLTVALAAFRHRKPLLHLTRVWRDRLTRWGLWRRPSWSDLGWSIGAFAVLYLSGRAYARLENPVDGDGTLTHWELILAGNHGFASQVGLIFLAVLLAPLLEELVWRGYLLGGGRFLLRQMGASRVVALVIPLVVSAALFGASHTHYTPAGQLGVAISGLIYGLVFLKTRNVLLAGAVHGASNTLWVLSVLTG